MGFLSENERQTLAAICDTLVPELRPGTADAESAAIMAYSPARYGLAEAMEEALARVTDAESQQQLRMLLRAFDVPLVNSLTGGEWGAFRKLPLAQREAILRDWANSRLFLRRTAFQSLKRLALFLAYANPSDGQPHPVWDYISYKGPHSGSPETARTITPYEIGEGSVLLTDVLIIGSGAGGGVVAGELSAAGYEVIVVEKGGYHAEADFDGDELRANQNLYERNGALTSADTSMMVLAGSTLGGGTTINWSASFQLPHNVREEWERDYGFSGITGPEFQHSLDAVSQRLGVNCDESYPNPNNAVLERGCQALGFQVEVIPRNVKGCEDCGYCGFGCAFGAKQGTLKTYLQDAYECGAHIIVRANVRRIMHEHGQVKGAVMEVPQADGRIRLVTVRANVVVVAAGSIHTPALLQRSGLTNPHIGGDLRLHPVTAVFSTFSEPVMTWQGVPMARVSKQFADLDGHGYGVLLETAPTHPGLFGSALPWTSGRQHKKLMARVHHIANLLCITRDRYGGRVTIDRFGEPVLHYTLDPYDRQHMMRGVIEALRVHRAAGAEMIYGPHNDVIAFDNRQNGHASDARFTNFLHNVRQRGLAPNAFPMFSAHQMASCKIGGSPEQGALKPTGESWEVENLYVADASVFPTASGVNPMMTVMGLAHYIAQQIKAAT